MPIRRSRSHMSLQSVTRKAIVGDELKPFGSGKSAFRFMVPRQKILDNPTTHNLVNREGYMTLWIGNDRRLVMYPCSNNSLLNFVAIHPSNLSASKGEGKFAPMLHESDCVVPPY